MSEENVKHIHIDGEDAAASETEDMASSESAVSDEKTASESAGTEKTGSNEQGSESASKEQGTESAEAAEKSDSEKEAADKSGTEKSDSDKAAANKGDSEKEAADKAVEEEKQESERYLRLLAEFQNFRRRTDKEKADIRAYANEKIIEELLPILDNFERALNTRTDDIENYAKGMELIFQQLLTAFDHAGVKEIPAEGEDFDPTKHHAVMTDQSDELEEGKISKVLQKGYTLNDRVIRPAMVAVVK